MQQCNASELLTSSALVHRDNESNKMITMANIFDIFIWINQKSKGNYFKFLLEYYMSRKGDKGGFSEYLNLFNSVLYVMQCDLYIGFSIFFPDLVRVKEGRRSLTMIFTPSRSNRGMTPYMITSKSYQYLSLSFKVMAACQDIYFHIVACLLFSFIICLWVWLIFFDHHSHCR